jgi:molybdopterin molybdotransferase
MRSVQEALTEILAPIQALAPQGRGLFHALGYVLAQEVRAANDLPPFDNTSMDGFAIRAADSAASPVTLTVIGDIPAGSLPTFEVGPGQAARIMTGGMLPAGADSVISVEQTDHYGQGDTLPSNVVLQQPVNLGQNVRRHGEDIQTGQVALWPGHLLRPQDLGLLAGLGISQVQVIPKPKVAILSTGDELLTPEQALQPGKIRDMNSYSLVGMVQSLGADPLYLGIARDSEAEMRHKLAAAVEQGAHVIVSSAGVSVGAYDVVKKVLAELGQLDFWKVNMRPGKPLAYGHVQGIPYFGLPGNPVSSLASFEIFVRPVLLKLMGLPTQVPHLEVTVGEAMTSDGRESYIRVRMEKQGGDWVAYSTGSQSSGVISSLVKADGLLVIPAGMTKVTQGERLLVRPFAGQALPF